MSNHLYHLGPCYCEKCGGYTIHRLNVERPFQGVGPTTPYNIWMDFIKKSRVICNNCGNARKPDDEIKALSKKVKDTHLFSLDQEFDFKNKIQRTIKNSGILDEYSEEKAHEIVDAIMHDYRDSNIPRNWFESYFLIEYKRMVQEKVISDYLY